MTNEQKQAIVAGWDSTERLLERIAALEKREREREEAEAAICPEDVGFPEYVGVLTKRIAALEKELRRVRQGYANIREFRRLANGRYGNLTAEEIDEAIVHVDAALSGSTSALDAVKAEARRPLEEALEVFASCPIHPNIPDDCDVRLVLPLGGELLHLKVAHLRRAAAVCKGGE